MQRVFVCSVCQVSNRQQVGLSNCAKHCICDLTVRVWQSLLNNMFWKIKWCNQLLCYDPALEGEWKIDLKFAGNPCCGCIYCVECSIGQLPSVNIRCRKLSEHRKPNHTFSIFLSLSLIRFGTDTRFQWSVARLFAKNEFTHFQTKRIQSISLSACSGAVKKVPDPENEVIKNKGGKKRQYKGYVDKKENNRIKFRGSVEVWRNITVKELAEVLKLDLGKSFAFRMAFSMRN